MKAVIATALLLAALQPATAQTSTPPAPGVAGQARPSRGPDQSSAPAAAPSPAPGQTTGTPPQSPVIQQMNDAEKKKVEQQGK